MIARYMRALGLLLPVLLVGALAAGCGGEGERPAGDGARDGARSPGVVGEAPPAGLDGPEAGASPVTGDPAAGTDDGSAGATGPGTSPGVVTPPGPGSTDATGAPGAASPSPGTGQAGGAGGAGGAEQAGQAAST
jgi:hypothetical protein